MVELEKAARARVAAVTGQLGYEDRPTRWTTEQVWAEWLVIQEVFKAVGSDAAEVLGISVEQVDEALDSLRNTPSRLLNQWKRELL